MMIRHSVLDISYLDNLKDKLPKNQYRMINGVRVKITSQRYKVFQDNLICVECGVKGEFLAIEKEENTNTKNYHINMYGLKNGEEVLMTKDHILPKSKGGQNIHSNYQTMCSVCNGNKGNGDKTVRELFNRFVYDKTDRHIKIIDKLCLELNVDQKSFWAFYLKSIGDFSEDDFFTDMLTHFHWYLDSTLDDLYSSVGIEMKVFFFDAEDEYVFFEDRNGEFKEKVLSANFEVRKTLMSNKIFAYFIKKVKKKIFSDKELRSLKIEKINKE